jgi:hypothetical protein
MPLKKYPEIVFEEGKFDRNDSTNTYVQAGYTVTASSQYIGNGTIYRVWKIFDEKLGGTPAGETWIQGNLSAYDSNGDYVLSPANNLGTGADDGEWVKLELPNKITLERIHITPRESNRAPEDFKIYGSIDNVNWVEILSETGASPAITTGTSYTVDVRTTSYKYLGMVIKKIVGSGYFAIDNLELYGYEEPAPPGDLSLDTTLKSTFNSVRSNNYVMYFDGEDPTGDPVVPKYLPSGSAKSITPNNVVFDATNNCWTLNGSTESNVTTGSLGFEGDVPHTVSTWINASNLEANATTQQLFSIGSGYSKEIVRVDDTQIAANTWHNVTYAYQGEGGSKVTYVDGRKVEETQVEDTFGEYPPFAMTDYETGGYRASASSELPHSGSNYKAWRGFDDYVTGNDNIWICGSGQYDGTGAYTGSTSTTVSGTGYSGEWLQIELPHKLKVNYVAVLPQNDTLSRAPKNGVFAGSNDGTTWNLLGSFTGITTTSSPAWSATVPVNFTLTSSTAYKYFRIIVTAGVSTSLVTVQNMQLYGHKEGDLTRFPEPTRVLEYPHIDVGVPRDTPAKRGYTVTTGTSIFSGRTGARAFDDQPTGDGWETNNGSFSDQVNQTGGDTFTNLGLGGGSFTGHWIQLEMPHKLKFTGHIEINAYVNGTTDDRRPDAGAFLGSNDGSNWYLLHEFTSGSLNWVSLGGTTNQAKITTLSASNTNAYKYVVMVITKKSDVGTSTVTRTSIRRLRYYGTEEDTGTPAIVGGPFAGKVANFRVYDQYLGDERIQEIYDAQKDEFGHKKSSMTFYKGRLGIGTTEPEGALTVIDEPHNLEMFPAHELVSNDTHMDGQGIIKVRSSYRGEHDRSLGVNDHAYRTDVHAYKAFMNDRNWTSYPERNTRMSDEVDFGAWLKIQTPQSISLKKAKIESNPEWKQVGLDVDGPGSGGNFGRAIACSHDGTRIIAGGKNYNSSQGVAKVYDWNGSAWTQVGQTLTGTWSDGQYGRAVAISGDGNIIAVSAPYEHTSYTDAGTVRVYYLSGSTWTVLPDSGSLTVNDIFEGTNSSVFLGMGRIQLSYNGKTLAMCEYGYDDGTNTDAGRVFVYQYSDGAWSYKGTGATQFVGSAANVHFGFGLSMSEDGNCLALGTLDAGFFVEVYTWDGSAWGQKGLRLNEPSSGSTQFGAAVSISNDGNILAVGIRDADVADGALATNGGLVHVYHWTGSAWGTPHKLTYNEAVDEDFAAIVELSGDGKRLIVGADDENSNQGEVFTFEYTGTSWVMRLPGIIGADGDTNGYLGLGPLAGGGHSIALSRDGSTIAGGELGHDSSNGRFRVFSMPSNIKSIWGSNDNENWTKITTAPTREEATSNVAGLAFGYDDRLEIKNLDNPNYYKYHAIVADAFTTLKNVRLYGIREKASSTIHDGTLTLTKNLVVPRIGPAFDTDDTPRRDRLVVEYTTSTSPIEYGYVKDTSGNGYNAKMVGVVYNPSDKSFECSASDGSQWIETYIPNGSRFNAQFTVSLWANMGQFDLSSLYGFLFGLGDRSQTGLSSTSGNEISLVYNHAGLNEGTFYAGIEGQSIIFKEWTTHDSHMGQWYHLAMTYDGSTLYVYKNGENSGYGARTAPVLPDDNCVVRLFGDAVNENATHQGVQARISNFKLYDCCLTRDEARTLYDMGRCDEGHHVVSFEKTRVGIGLGDGSAPKAELDVRGTARIGPSGQEWRTTSDDAADRLLQFHSGQAVSGQPTLEVTHYGGTRASPTPTVLQISNELGGGADWSTTEPYGMLSFATADGTGSGFGGPAASVGAVSDTVNSGGDTRLAFFTNSGTVHLERMCVNHDGLVGIGMTDPAGVLDVVATQERDYIARFRNSSTSSDQDARVVIECTDAGGEVQLMLVTSNESNRAAWHVFAGSGNGTLQFHYQSLTSSLNYNEGTIAGYITRKSDNNSLNFTGQHRTFIKDVPFSQAGDLEGLIVSSDQNKYIKMSGGIEAGSNAITTNESLPIVSISTISNDKKCFGVISTSEDPETREEAYGSFVSVSQKEIGDTRVYINSVGEGAIWVVNTNGPLESGDYITTSNVAGYGQKQDSEFLANYTVAKITMDCDFNPVTQPVQNIKKEMGEVKYWFKTTYENVTEEEYSNLTDENRRIVDGIYQKITKEESKKEKEGYELEVRQELVNVLDEHGQVQWEDDPSGATEKAYKIRYLDADGNITDEANAVHKAAFVGCTYHCG